MKKEIKNPKEKMNMVIKVELGGDGRSGLHYKDYRETEIAMTRTTASQLMDRLEFIVNELEYEIKEAPETPPRSKSKEAKKYTANPDNFKV